jgi:predicted outer membrane repeat protein
MIRSLLVLALLALAPAPASAAPSSACTYAGLHQAVAKGGTVRLDCPPGTVIPVRRTLTATRPLVLDGGGTVTLDGLGEHRILSATGVKVVLRGLTFTRGAAYDGDGGGAVLLRGGRLVVDHATFTRNRCDKTGPDVGGAAIRILPYDKPIRARVSGSTFTRNRCSNGAGLSSIGVSWVVRDSTFTGNRAIGRGANPARPGTPGGGSGAGMYFDGNTFTVRLEHVTMTGNTAREGGGAIFFVSNDRTGTLSVRDSRLSGNPSLGFENYPGIFYLGHGAPDLGGSVVE